MFDNIGGKIKGLAKSVCWFGIVVCVITGISMMAYKTGNPYNNYPLLWPGVEVAVLGSLLSWVGSFALYGFGELIENSRIIRDELLSKQGGACPTDSCPSGEEADAGDEGENRTGTDGSTWICPHCFTVNPNESLKCSNCGKLR